MNLVEVLSMIGMYILIQIFVGGSYMFAFFMDNELYKKNKYNENRNTIKIGLKWLFWRSEKDDSKEIFIISFVHEVISAILFLVVTAMFIVTITLNEQMIMYISLVPIIMYFLYTSIRQRYISRKL